MCSSLAVVWMCLLYAAMQSIVWVHTWKSSSTLIVFAMQAYLHIWRSNIKHRTWYAQFHPIFCTVTLNELTLLSVCAADMKSRLQNNRRLKRQFALMPPPSCFDALEISLCFAISLMPFMPFKNSLEMVCPSESLFSTLKSVAFNFCHIKTSTVLFRVRVKPWNKGRKGANLPLVLPYLRNI